MKTPHPLNLSQASPMILPVPVVPPDTVFDMTAFFALPTNGTMIIDPRVPRVLTATPAMVPYVLDYSQDGVWRVPQVPTTTPAMVPCTLGFNQPLEPAVFSHGVVCAPGVPTATPAMARRHTISRCSTQEEQVVQLQDACRAKGLDCSGTKAQLQQRLKNSRRAQCQHNQRKAECTTCLGSSICMHGRRKYFCRACGGGGICKHGRAKSYCKECGRPPRDKSSNQKWARQKVSCPNPGCTSVVSQNNLQRHLRRCACGAPPT
jgi:hypothetical protein